MSPFVRQHIATGAIGTVAILLALVVGVSAGEIASGWGAAGYAGYAPTYATALADAGHADIDDPPQPTDPAYLEMLAQQQRWEDANPRLRDVWTARRRGETWAIVVDAGSDLNRNGTIDQDAERGRPPGTPTADFGEAFLHATHGDVRLDPTIHTDGRGAVVIGYAPIRDGDGRVDAVVGVALDAAPIRNARAVGGVVAGLTTFLATLLAATVATASHRASRLRDQIREVEERTLTVDEERVTTAAALDEARRRTELIVARIGVPAALRRGNDLVPNARLAAMLGEEVRTPDAWFKAAWGPHADLARRLYDMDRAAGFPEPRLVGLRDASGACRTLAWSVASVAGDELWIFPEAPTQGDAARWKATADTLVDAIDALDVGVGIFDADQRLVRCNDPYRRALGAASESCVQGAERQALLDACVASNGHWHSGLGEAEWLQARSDQNGDSRAERTEFGWVRLRSAETAQRGRVDTVTDITDERGSQSDLREALTASESSARVRVDFLARTSHELRTPLMAIQGFLDLADDPDLPEHTRTTHLATVRESVARLVAVLDGRLEHTDHPRAPAAPPPLRKRVQTRPTLDGRILLAEDGRDNQLLITTHLGRAGADVEVVTDGEAAVDRALRASREGVPFDLLILDMQMPIADGYTAAARLRATGYRGAILALTAHAMPGDREKCLAAGCDAYLAKPVERQSLLEAVSAHLAPHSEPETESTGCRPEDDPAVAELVERFRTDLPTRVTAVLDAAWEGDREAARTVASHLAASAHANGFPAVARAARRVLEAMDDPGQSVRLQVRLLDLAAVTRGARAHAPEGASAG